MMNNLFMPHTVGVAPGTTTIHLGANPMHFNPGFAPEMRRVNAYDRTHDEAMRRAADPAAFFTQPRVNVGVTHMHDLQGPHMYSPYGDFYALRSPYPYSSQGVPSGFQLYGTGAVDTRARIRWDLIGAIGGGALIISLGAGLIASLLK